MMVRLPGAAEHRDRLERALDNHLTDDGRLVCPFCGQEAQPIEIVGQTVGSRFGEEINDETRYNLIRVICAGCSENMLYARRWVWKHEGDDWDEVTEWLKRAHPLG
jgi:hypothetical protein